MLKNTFVIACVVATVAVALPLSEFVNHVSGRGVSSSVRPSTKEIVDAFTVEGRDTSNPLVRKHLSGDLLAWYESNDDTVSGYHPEPLTASPEQLHISITEHPGNVTVLWTTSNVSQNAQVCYQQVASEDAVDANSWTCADGKSWTYDPISLIPWFGTLHSAQMTDLSAGKLYCYRVGDPVAKNISYSNTTCFVAPDLEKEELLVAFGGDMGSYQLCGHLMATQMRDDELRENLKYDAFWMLGDIAYSTLDPPKDNFESLWDVYMRQEQSFIDHIPFLATYGNHDFSGGDSGAFINRYRNPQGGNGNANFYWSYTHGPVYYISMCTEKGINPKECDYAPGSVQYLWLEQQMASVNRTKYPWLILAGHRPMYSSDKATDSGPLQKYIEPLLKKYNVDLELAGHMHETEITAPVMNDKPEVGAVMKVGPVSYRVKDATMPVHVTVGMLGAMIHEKYVEPKPMWSLFRNGTLFDNAYGYTRMKINRTSIHMQAFRQVDNSLMWSYELVKTD